MKVFSILIGILIFGCAPTNSGNESKVKKLTPEEKKQRNKECALNNSFAAGNFQNQDWRGAVDNWKKMMENGCDLKDVYTYYGRAYINLNKLDSASYIFKQGLKHLNDDEELFEIAQWTAGKTGDLDAQIYYLDKWLALDETNLKVLNKFSEVYKNNGKIDEQIEILNMILKVSPGDKSANAEKKAAFQALGRDELDVDKERWNAEPSNIQYGKDYIKGLLDRERNEEAIFACNELMVYDKYDTEILKYLGDAHLNLYNEVLAIETYEKIATIDKNDYLNAIELSKLYINKEEFETALAWAEKAVRFSGKKGVALYQRGDVYFSLAESCSTASLDFWDRLVFEMAWQDCLDAAKSGYSRAKKRADFLEENNITEGKHWFMGEFDKEEMSPSDKEEPHECYSWIKRTIKKKEIE